MRGIDIGAWHHVGRARVKPYNAMKVWDGVSGTKIDFNWDAPSSPTATATSGTIAYMTENINLTHGLISRLDELGGVEILDKMRVEGITNGIDDGEVDLSSWPVVEVCGGRRLTARLLVGADGANSPVRKWAEVESRGWDYGKMGVVATLQLQGSGMEGQKTAYQRFLPTGPVAFLPVSVPRYRAPRVIHPLICVYWYSYREILRLWFGQRRQSKLLS